MAEGAAPDVFAACCSFFPILAQEGYTLDLAPLVAAIFLAVHFWRIRKDGGISGPL